MNGPALVEHDADRPNLLPDVRGVDPGAGALQAAVKWVGGITDRYACRRAITLLGWECARLPGGIDTR